MGPREKQPFPKAPTLGELMEAEWLLVEVAVIQTPHARRFSFTDWLPEAEPKRRLALAA